MFLLDTNTVIDYFKGKGKVNENFLARSPDEIALPAVVVYEVWFRVLGSQSSARRQSQFEQFLSVLPVIGFDAAVAKEAAQLRHTLERRGEKIGPIDTLIAATALAHAATLVTHNVQEFTRVPGLTLVDWYE